ncbi:hypothetical protein M2451_004011 [Dysgonomonas sp. PFB1-18]|uniref:hypothetical protein n=1 Tax=unclassified Dysgonomonas TaxID=2630389 RepID=UPI0024733F96|nr:MULTISPECIES: hypothetical protein [unclassified Dysgonomonas]MDH6310483.1 hypothetical protein [Dysgonomonas sp. PF1-14]MDH6340921.1 hypothetical protein [Dysgonomonas sp. PF1-16]MDH6382664.1 hypothetical protein [Dysgonomonas sp. PFB1-18]MDH6399884.1 hypothetical protein [Dysgonomonas sp. PF1-23]
MIKIQISNPELSFVKNKDDASIEEALESIFLRNTEYAVLIWENLFIPLSYKYDISIMAKDFIKILEFIEGTDSKIEIHWASNTFSSIWYLTKLQNGELEIKSLWVCVLGELRELLTKKSNICVTQIAFSKELRKMLFFLKDCLDKCGYTANELYDYNLLIKYI